MLKQEHCMILLLASFLLCSLNSCVPLHELHRGWLSCKCDTRYKEIDLLSKVPPQLDPAKRWIATRGGDRQFVCNELADNYGCALVGPLFPAYDASLARASPRFSINEFAVIPPDLSSERALSLAKYGMNPRGYRADSRYTWVPVDQIENGDTIITWLAVHADNSEVFDCNNGKCNTIVRNANDAGRLFSVCEVWGVEGRYGVPQHCETVAARSGKVWLRGISYLRPLPGPAAPPGSAKLKIAGTLPTLSKVAAALKDALSAEPLQLSMGVQVTTFNAILTGSRSQALSSINKPYRESVSIITVASGSDNSIIVDATISLWVSLQNTGRDEDYRCPTDAQRDKYVAQFVSSVKTKLEGTCAKATWADDTTLHCE
jgi:hypothetical protein